MSTTQLCLLHLLERPSQNSKRPYSHAPHGGQCLELTHVPVAAPLWFTYQSLILLTIPSRTCPLYPSGSCPSFCPACFKRKSPSLSPPAHVEFLPHFPQGNLSLSADFLPRRSSAPQQLAASKVLSLDPTESSLEITFCRLGLPVCGPNKAFP